MADALKTDAPAAESFAPGTMNRTEAHPIELAIVAAWVVMEALLTLVVAVAGLVVTLAQWRPAATAAAPVPTPEPPVIEPIPARPTPHPLAALADRLAELPVATLRGMAGTRSKAIHKAELIARVIACS